MKTLLLFLLISSAYAQPTPNTHSGVHLPPPPPQGPVHTSPTNWNTCTGRRCGSEKAIGLTTKTGIALDTAWKISLYEFAKRNVVHQSWGLSHSERNYQNALMIAREEGLQVDFDVLFAASFLHDLGGLPGFEQPNVDHGVRSGQLAPDLLRKWGFPENKIEDVVKVVIDHVYTHEQPTNEMSQIFRDADMIDFLGVMGVSRLLAANLEMGDSPDIANSIKVIESMNANLPAKFAFESSRRIGVRRITEAQVFLKTLKAQAFNGVAY